MSSDIDRREWDALHKRMTGAGMDDAIDKGIKGVAGEAEEWIKAATPVKTGALKGSMHTDKLAKADYFVGTDTNRVRYAGWVEWGHRMPQGGYYAGAAMVGRNVQRIDRRLYSALQEIVKRRAGTAAK